MMFSPRNTAAKATVTVFIVIGALLLAACGGNGEADVDVDEPTANGAQTAEQVEPAQEPDEHAAMGEEAATEQVAAEESTAKDEPRQERRLGREVTVDVGEMYFDVEPSAVKAGTVTVHMKNEGAIEHDVVSVDNTHMAPDQMPMAHDGTPDIDKDAGTIHMHADPGEMVTKEVNLEPGEYVLVCTFPGHYEAGQAAALRVVR